MTNKHNINMSAVSGRNLMDLDRVQKTPPKLCVPLKATYAFGQEQVNAFARLWLFH
jgi:hypothetical protein